MPAPPLPIAVLHLDESCLGNGQQRATPGGGGGLIEARAGRAIHRRDFYIHAPDTTNNRMALASAIAALQLLAGKGKRLRVLLVSDSESLVKGFTMDDERLRNPPGPGQTVYFDALLERIRDIRASERRFYEKVLDIYATSVDYQPELSQQFFATVQNKMHFAAHVHTAAEMVDEPADAEKPFMGMQPTRPGGEAARPRAASCSTMPGPSPRESRGPRPRASTSATTLCRRPSPST